MPVWFGNQMLKDRRAAMMVPEVAFRNCWMVKTSLVAQETRAQAGGSALAVSMVNLQRRTM